MDDPGQSTAPAPGLTLRLELPDNLARPGETFQGTLIVTNDTSTAVQFSITRTHEDDGTLIAASGWAASTRTGTDAIVGTIIDLGPRETEQVPVDIRTDTCGPSVGEYEPLPAGRYEAMAELFWQTDAASGHWWSPMVPVTLE